MLIYQKLASQFQKILIVQSSQILSLVYPGLNNIFNCNNILISTCNKLRGGYYGLKSP